MFGLGVSSFQDLVTRAGDSRNDCAIKVFQKGLFGMLRFPYS